MMDFGLKQKTIESIQAVLARHPAVEKCVLYGSRAKGNFKPGSDIDLTLYGDNLTSLELGTIADELDDLLLPYQIDLSIFSRISSLELQEHIDRIGVIFYEQLKD